MRSIDTTIALPVEQAEARVRAALADNGFGVLTEIDVAAALLLPCNVVLEPGDGGGTRVAAVDPRELMPDPALADLAASAAAVSRHPA